MPRLLFAYRWIEDVWIEGERIEGERAEGARIDAEAADAPPASAARTPLVRIQKGFTPPLFYSMGCFARHVLNHGECFDDCPKDFRRQLRQGRNRFTVIVRDCVTYLFAEEALGPAG